MGLFDSGRQLLYYIGMDERVDYKRDGLSVGESVSAKVGQSSVSEQDNGGATMHVHRLDFIIRKADLDIGCPAVRDVIEWNGKRYAVCDTEYERCWRWHDRVQTVYRIHTEEVDYEPTN